MKTLKKISLAMFMLLGTIQMTQAQALDYKGHRIEASGKILDAAGRHVGNVTAEGVITDASGEKVAYADGKGSLIDAKSGKSLGKIGKNGNFVPYSSSETWSVGSPQDGVCLVKDKDGVVKAVVHETYKNIGACAAWCLAHHMKQGEVLDESNVQALYACPMHPEVTSDKPGKCSKCGMALVKKSK
jgi:Heavy metal binding domain